MNERIKQLRKNLDLTQQEFSERIGIKRNTIATYESGRNEPIDAVISLICREFNVNEEWLRNGTGEMFAKSDTFSLDEFARQHNATALDIEFLKVYFDLDVRIRTALIEHFKNKFLMNNADSAYDKVPRTPDKLETLYPPVDTEENAG